MLKATIEAKYLLGLIVETKAGEFAKIICVSGEAFWNKEGHKILVFYRLESGGNTFQRSEAEIKRVISTES